jgi:sugar lactone lactonase YvrE
VHRRVPIPAHGFTNVRFGGADNRDLYITAHRQDALTAFAKGEMPAAGSSTLYRARADVAGLPPRRTRFRLTG